MKCSNFAFQVNDVLHFVAVWDHHFPPWNLMTQATISWLMTWWPSWSCVWIGRISCLKTGRQNVSLFIIVDCISAGQYLTSDINSKWWKCFFYHFSDHSICHRMSQQLQVVCMVMLLYSGKQCKKASVHVPCTWKFCNITINNLYKPFCTVRQDKFILPPATVFVISGFRCKVDEKWVLLAYLHSK